MASGKRQFLGLLYYSSKKKETDEKDLKKVGQQKISHRCSLRYRVIF